MLDFPNSPPHPGMGKDDPVWQRRVQNGQFYLSELVPILSMAVQEIRSNAVQDFVTYNALPNGELDDFDAWNNNKRVWSALLRIQALGVTFRAEDGSALKVTLSELTPFLQKREVDGSAERSKEIIDKMTGVSDTPSVLFSYVPQEMLCQDPIVQLRKLTETDYEQAHKMISKPVPSF